MKKLKYLLFAGFALTTLVLSGCDITEPTIEYTIDFNSMGGSVVESIKVKKGEKATKPNDPTKDDATFAGWYEQEELDVKFDFNQPILKDYTLYAAWNDITFTITFDSQGGSEVAPITVKKGGTISKPTDPIKENATFAGWYEQEELDVKFDFNQPIFKDYTLYAAWNDITFTVTFDSQGGSEVAPITVKKGGTISKPTDPTRDEYNFTGWFEDNNLTTLFDFTKAIEKNYTLYAGWEEIPVIFELKTAVFADVQLCAKEYGDGFAANYGTTSHAYIALKNNFALAKEKNVDVIVMDGDIVNNAVEEYYKLFEHAFTSVYGNNENQYPEFVWTMGNHEWWGLDEREDANAIALFKQHARIETVNLVRKSNVKFSLDNNETLPTYYKVINGVPFVSISGEDADGLIGETLKQEIASWLNEIADLPYVRKGGNIYISYHYPLSNSMTHGHGSHQNAGVLEDLLKDYPQAVVFTGHTHYPAVNERAIDQKDFTTINIGTSSYSVLDNRSATMADYESYYNVDNADGKEGMLDNLAFKCGYTPTIQFVDTLSSRDTIIDRYFSSDDVKDATKINGSWTLPSNINKDKFEYTNERFENANYAQTLYGANGLSWDENAEVQFGINNDMMTIKFPDVINYHYAEHFKIEVTGETSKTYDVVSNYYKYNKTAENLYFFLKDLPAGDNYSVKVTAYDYFDNPSLNYLQSDVRDDTQCVDNIDYALSKTYTDISTRVNFDDVALNSGSSLEYYYNGVARMASGATLNKIVLDGDKDASEFITIGDLSAVEVIVKAKVKNLTNDTLTFGLTVVDNTGDWRSDFSKPTIQTVSTNNEWVSLEWNLTELYGLAGRKSITHVGLKVASDAYNNEGYTMHFLLDDVDIAAGNEVDTNRGAIFSADSDYTIYVDIALNQTINIDFKFTSASDTYLSFMLGHGWGDWLGYYKVYANGALDNNYNGVSIIALDDGYFRVTVVPSQLDKLGDGSLENIDSITLFYIRSDYTTASGYVDFDSNADAGVLRGQTFSAGVDTTINAVGITDLNTSLVFDVKFTSGEGTYLNVCLLDESWANYLGYFEIYSEGNLTENYDGVSIQTLSDGYYRITINLAQVTKKVGDPATIDILYIRGGYTTASGYIDFNPAI